MSVNADWLFFMEILFKLRHTAVLKAVFNGHLFKNSFEINFYMTSVYV